MATSWAAGRPENLEAACDASFDAGWQFGELKARCRAEVDVNDAEASGAYDDGYLDGVDHARRRPDLADEMVQDIINDAADESLRRARLEYDAALVQDSGDEA
jgi:hypothetical protein